MQCRLRRSGGTATCKTVDRRDCAPHTVMRAGRPRTRHARGSIMLHFAIGGCPLRLARPSPLASRFSPLASRLSPHPLSPLASLVSRLLPHPLSPHPLATVPAAGPGAAPLRPSTLSSHVQRATCNLQPLSPHPLRHCPRCRSGRNAAAPFHVVVPRATCNVQSSTPLAPRLLPARLARDCAMKPSMDRKPVSPRSAVRRPPM